MSFPLSFYLSRRIVKDKENMTKYLSQNTMMSTGSMLFFGYAYFKKYWLDEEMSGKYLSHYSME
jgi:hypothetical protein